MWIWSEWEGKTSQLHVLKSVPCLFCTVNVYAYSVTFCIANGTVTSLSSLVKVSFMKLFVLMQAPGSKSTSAGYCIVSFMWWKFKDVERPKKQECRSSFLNPEPLTWRIVVKHKQLNKKQEGNEREMWWCLCFLLLFVFIVSYLQALVTRVKVTEHGEHGVLISSWSTSLDFFYIK